MAGKITSAEWIEAADDAQAEVEARDRSNGGTCEVWDRNRFVAKVGS
jgi:hypothetical protein